MNGRGQWVYTLLFAMLAFLIMLWHLIPLELQASDGVQPDVLLCLLAAWVVRRPEHLPLLVVAPVLLLSDLVLGRPVGLWALLSLLMAEALAARRSDAETRAFLVEWATFAAGFAILLTLQGLILRVALVERPPATVSLQLFVITVLTYPAVVLVLRTVFYVRAPKPAERSRRLGRVA